MKEAKSVQETMEQRIYDKEKELTVCFCLMFISLSPYTVFEGRIILYNSKEWYMICKTKPHIGNHYNVMLRSYSWG